MARPFSCSVRPLRKCLRHSSTTNLALTDVVAIYKARVARGQLDPDEKQLRTVLLVDLLHTSAY